MRFHFILLVLLTVFIKRLASEVATTEERFATPCLTPNHQPAFCIEIQKCTILYEQLEKRNNESFDFIKDSGCGPKNENQTLYRVCCGTFSNYVNKFSTTPSALYLPTPQPQPSNLLPKRCGIQDTVLNNRIFGGTEAELGEFPWMVRIRHRNRYNYTSYGCSGFLIHKRFILTAAHCLITKAIEPLGPVIGVVLGAHSDSEKQDCVIRDKQEICSDPPVFVEVDKIIIHENYEPIQHLNDIALLHLKKKVTPTTYIKPICLSGNSTDQEELWISGWGRTETDMSSAVKQKVSVPRVNTTLCAERYKRLNMNVRSTQLCAGGVEGRDSCAGDSGGPLMALGKNNVWFAEGIVSYGSGCGRQHWPGVYTNVPMYVNWIKDQIRNNTRPKRTTIPST